MQVLFTVLAISGGLFFLFKRRTFDYFALAFFSALIYFMPGFVGTAANYVDGVWSSDPLHPEVMWIMIFVLCSIWLSALVAAQSPRIWKFQGTLAGESNILSIMVFVSLLAFAGLVASSGASLLNPDKGEVLETLNRWHIVYYVSITLGMPLAFHSRRYRLAALFLVLLLVNLYLGFRSPLAISLIATAVVYLHADGRKRLITSNWKLLMMMLLFGLFMFSFKMIWATARAGLWDQVWNYLQNENVLYFALFQSEPFLVQQTLNQVVVNRFETGFDHVLTSLYQFTLFAPELGAENVTFNGIFQPALFPEVSYGLAANIWAQMWSAGGWPMLVVFTVFFNLILGLGNLTLQARSLVLRAGLAPMFCYWAFYIHRNELSFAFALEKRLLLLLFSVAVIAAVVKSATRQDASFPGVGRRVGT